MIDPLATAHPDTSSFTDYLRRAAPQMVPGNRSHAGSADGLVAHGTTIVALTFAGGVLIAGDRRATMGNLIAQRDIDKVFVTDSHSAVGIAGTAGIAIELVRLYAVELEHYEKIEGMPLSLDGKANRLAAMVRSNLGAAMQGLAVVPLFVGFDTDAMDSSRAGRIITYDITGGRYEEHAGFHSVGSGSLFARSALKKRYEAAADRDTAVRAAVEALYDAADDDSATGGPDLVRGLYPTVVTITAEHGAVRVDDEQVGEIAQAVVTDRHTTPGG